MNGVTCPVSGLTITMRELLLLPLVRRLWLESDANSRPPWKATAVGAFSPVTKADTLKPGGTTMSSPLPGLKVTSSPEQSGLTTVAAVTRSGGMRSSASATVKTNQRTRSTLLRISTPSRRYATFFAPKRLARGVARRAASLRAPRRGSTRADVTEGGDHRGAPHEFLARLKIPEARDTFPEPGDEVCGRMFPESEDDVKRENT